MVTLNPATASQDMDKCLIAAILYELDLRRGLQGLNEKAILLRALQAYQTILVVECNDRCTPKDLQNLLLVILESLKSPSNP